MHPPLLPLLLAGLTTCSLLVGCAASQDDSRVQVVAGAYPLAWLAEQVGGRDVRVVDLVKPGAEPHDIELTPRQVGAIEKADLVLRLAGFQAAVDDALHDGRQGLDLAAVMGERDGDPHVWLDPVRMQQAATAVVDRLVEADPVHADGYRARAEQVRARLGALDATFRTALADCPRRDLVTSHSAFGYLAARYDLDQRGISGRSPETEPSPRDLARAATFARTHGVTTIFSESLVDPKTARTVAAEIGATTALLDPVEGVADGDDYLTVQRRNAAALHTALGCS